MAIDIMDTPKNAYTYRQLTANLAYPVLDNTSSRPVALDMRSPKKACVLFQISQ